MERPLEEIANGMLCILYPITLPSVKAAEGSFLW